MKKQLILIFFLLIPIITVYGNSQSSLIQKELQVAISDLKTKIPLETRIGVDNLKDDSSTNDITDFLISALTKAGYATLDRRSMKRIFDQQGIEMGNAFDQESVQAVGQINGVDAIIYGTVKDNSSFLGKTNLIIHLQFTYIGEGNTAWAYDVVSNESSVFWDNLPYLIVVVILALFILVFIGLKKSGRTKHAYPVNTGVFVHKSL